LADAPRRGGSRRTFLGLGLAVVVALTFLAIGSVHPLPAGAARVRYLESVLKCPSCTDLSIGQSTDNIAQALDRDVARGVAAGESNDAIESAVLAKYPGAILEPRGGLGALVVAIPAALVALAGAAGVTFLVRARRRGVVPAVGGGGAGG